MCHTSNAVFLLFKIALSGILNPEKLELNIGKLELRFGSSEKNNDIYVLANEDDELVENDDRPDDYKSVKASMLEKAILSKLTGAGSIEKNIKINKGEHQNRSEPNGILKKGSKKQTWKEISEKWKEMKNQRDTFSIKDVKSSNTFEYSEVTCKSN